MFRLKLVALVSALLLVVGVSPASADIWFPKYLEFGTDQQKSSVELTIFELSQANAGGRWLEWNTGGYLGNPSNRSVPCVGQGWGYGECTDSSFENGATVRFQSSLAGCKTADEIYCVESVSITSVSNPDAKTALLRNISNQFTYPPLSSVLLPGSSGSSLWKSDVAHEGGNEYIVGFNVAGDLAPGQKAPTIVQANIFVQPVRQVSKDYPLKVGEHRMCAMIANTDGCFYMQNFAADTKVDLTIRAPKALGGWFYGQISNPNINIGALSDSVNRIKISGGAQDVEGLYVAYPLAGNEKTSEGIRLGAGWPKPITEGFHIAFGPSWNAAVPAVEAVRAVSKDMSTFTYSQWGMHLVDQGLSKNACLDAGEGIRGIVTTNAMAYAKGIPTFKNGQFDFSVAGMHYKSDGATAVTGHYDFLLSSTVARCLYGFSKAPIYGVVNVVSATGEQKIATTAVSEKDGWVRISAHNFTFSTNVIKAKLSQTKPKTITCVKGKLVKKVTGLGPKCPSGYKAK